MGVGAEVSPGSVFHPSPPPPPPMPIWYHHISFLLHFGSSMYYQSWPHARDSCVTVVRCLINQQAIWHRVHTMFHLPERTPELGLLHLFSWRVNGKCVFQELGLPRLLCTTKLIGFATGAVAAPAIFLASEQKAGAAPAIYVNIRWISRTFLQGSLFLHLVPHMQYFVFNVLHYVRKWTSSVHWIEHATSIHVASYFRLALVKRNWIIREITKIIYGWHSALPLNRAQFDTVHTYMYVYRCRSYHGYRIGPADCTTRAFKAREIFVYLRLWSVPGAGAAPPFRTACEHERELFHELGLPHELGLLREVEHRVNAVWDFVSGLILLPICWGQMPSDEMLLTHFRWFGFDISCIPRRFQPVHFPQWVNGQLVLFENLLVMVRSNEKYYSADLILSGVEILKVVTYWSNSSTIDT